MANMKITASRVISFAEGLEDRSQAFYEALADRFADERETFLGFAKGCRKTRQSVVRTYRETVSDALETGFSFAGLDLERYEVDTALAEEVTFGDALERAIELEEQATAFYETVAERSRALLATIPMAFKSAAKKRQRRRRKLEALLD
jgi:rubrerythrin